MVTRTDTTANQRLLYERAPPPTVFRPVSLSRWLPVVGALTGLVHLLAPRTLLAVAGRAYDRSLAVDFEPRESAVRRVRVVGVGMLVGAAALARRTDGE